MTTRRIDDAGICARYGVLPKDAAAWIKLVNFPAAGDDGLRDTERVDAWVRAMRPQYWPPKPAVAPTASAPRPAAGGEALRQYLEENPGLLTLKQVAELDGMAQGRSEPTPLTTLRDDAKRGVLPRAARLPGDGGTPEVDEAMWRPETVLPYLARPGAGAAKPSDSAPSVTAPRTQGTERRPEMAKRFNMSYQAVDAWTKARERRDAAGNVVAAAFPSPVSKGRWDTEAVDTWVRKNRSGVWTAYSGSKPQFVKPLPEGHPEDLLDISEYGIIRGNALSGKPLQRRTMQSYLLRKQIAAPDRMPKDRKRPEVFQPMWFRKTIYSEIRQRLPRGKSEGA